MPKSDPKLVVAESRMAEATRIVAQQSELIAKLKAAGQPSFDAEQALLTYISALKHLEAHAAIVRAEVGTKKHETKKGRRFRGKNLSLNDLLSYCVADDLGDRMQIKLAHDGGPMRVDCLEANSKHRSDLSSPMPLGHQA
jgi:hypothetical protein